MNLPSRPEVSSLNSSIIYDEKINEKKKHSLISYLSSIPYNQTSKKEKLFNFILLS